MATPPVQYQYQQAPVPQKTNSMAIVGFILSFFFAIVGAILGFIALGQIKKSNGTEGGKGLAVAAVVIGLLWTIPLLIIVILRILGPQIGGVFESINASLSGV